MLSEIPNCASDGHEATEMELSITIKQRKCCCKSHDNDNMEDVVQQDLIHTTHIHTL